MGQQLSTFIAFALQSLWLYAGLMIMVGHRTFTLISGQLVTWPEYMSVMPV